MHEAPIAQALFDAAVAALPQPGAKITRFLVVAGPFSGVDAECLRFYLTELCRGTPSQDAEMAVRVEPAKLICQSCGNIALCDNGSSVQFTCTKCGQPNTVQGGHDLYLDSIEVAQD
jgi:Zn finger protein HypA/HybF involved in hydrogenase expression